MADWFIAPAAQAILAQATEQWPDRSRISDGTIGDPAHASRTSDHNPDESGEVLAADLTHDPAHGCDAHAWAEATRRRCKAGQEHRVTYQISNRRIYSARSGWEWVAYTGDNPHEKHVHTSIDKAHAADKSPWFVNEELTVAEVNEIINVVRKQGQKTRRAVKAAAMADARRAGATKAQLRDIEAAVDRIEAEDD